MVESLAGSTADELAVRRVGKLADKLDDNLVVTLVE